MLEHTFVLDGLALAQSGTLREETREHRQHLLNPKQTGSDRGPKKKGGEVEN
jgi:hypothetical protein